MDVEAQDEGKMAKITVVGSCRHSLNDLAKTTRSIAKSRYETRQGRHPNSSDR